YITFAVSFFRLFFLILLRPPISTLFPYTTLFRSNYHVLVWWFGIDWDYGCRSRKSGEKYSESNQSGYLQDFNFLCRSVDYLVFAFALGNHYHKNKSVCYRF